MKLADYIRTSRKSKYPKASTFLQLLKNEMPHSNYYAIERGAMIPKMKDLVCLIKALKLDPKFAILLWVHDQIPESDSIYKKYFPIVRNEEEQGVFRSSKQGETTLLSKAHIDFFINDPLALLVLHFFFINSSAPLSVDYVSKEFKKHPAKNVIHSIKNLLKMGYVFETSPDHLKANSSYLHIPDGDIKEDARDYKKLNFEDIASMITNGHFGSLETDYGHYPKGLKLYQRRTFTPEQFLYVKEILQNAVSEIYKLPPSAGQEFNMAFILSAMYEK